MRHLVTLLLLMNLHVIMTSNSLCANDRHDESTRPSHAVCANQYIIEATKQGNIPRLERLLKKYQANVNDMRDNSTLLHMATEHGRENVLRRLVDRHGGNICAVDSQTDTLLHVAARHGHEGIVVWLLETRSSWLHAANSQRCTPLHYAAFHGHAPIVQLLVNAYPEDVDAEDAQNNTPLHLAASNGHEHVVRLLVKASRVNIHSQNHAQETPLQCALRNKHHEAARLILDAAPFATAPFEWTALHNAAHQGDAASATAILTDYATLNIPDRTGFTPLHYAARGGHIDVVQALLRHGADISQQDHDGLAPFHIAALHGHGKILSLLSNPTDVALLEQNHKGVLLRAVENGHYLLVKTHISAIANIGRFYWAPELFNLAVSMGLCPVIKTLLHQHVPFPKCKDRMTALHVAALHGHTDAVQLLISASPASLAARDAKGRTPLHHAARNGHAATVTVLIEAGADPNAKDASRWTPLHHAARNGHDAVISTLVICTTAHDVDWDGMSPAAIAGMHGHYTSILHFLLAGHWPRTRIN